MLEHGLWFCVLSGVFFRNINSKQDSSLQSRLLSKFSSSSKVPRDLPIIKNTYNILVISHHLLLYIPTLTMKFSAFATVYLGANAALAARLTEKRREQHAARALSRQSNLRLPPTNSEGIEYPGNDTSHVEYSSNWAGAVLIGTGYKSVTGTFTVPTPSTPSGGSSRTEVSFFSTSFVADYFIMMLWVTTRFGLTILRQSQYAASAWVGIDGDTASNSILQTGVDFYVEGSEIGFDAWYEWYPDYA